MERFGRFDFGDAGLLSRGDAAAAVAGGSIVTAPPFLRGSISRTGDVGARGSTVEIPRTGDVGARVTREDLGTSTPRFGKVGDRPLAPETTGPLDDLTVVPPLLTLCPTPTDEDLVVPPDLLLTATLLVGLGAVFTTTLPAKL